jgi:hypothetical protein
MELSGESKEAQLRHAETLKKYEAQRRARAIVVPTAIDDVKSKLRELGHPVTLFGEGHVDRRERLREVIASLELGQEELARVQVRKLNFVFLLALKDIHNSSSTFSYTFTRNSSISNLAFKLEHQQDFLRQLVEV